MATAKLVVLALALCAALCEAHVCVTDPTMTQRGPAADVSVWGSSTCAYLATLREPCGGLAPSVPQRIPPIGTLKFTRNQNHYEVGRESGFRVSYATVGEPCEADFDFARNETVTDVNSRVASAQLGLEIDFAVSIDATVLRLEYFSGAVRVLPYPVLHTVLTDSI